MKRRHGDQDAVLFLRHPFETWGQPIIAFVLHVVWRVFLELPPRHPSSRSRGRAELRLPGMP